MQKTEASVLKRVMLASAQLGMTLWRNNVGKAYMGTKLPFVRATLHHENGERTMIYAPDAVIISAPRFVDFGLCKGSADLIGVEPHVVTQADVGRTLGVFVALECKRDARSTATAQQQNFVEFIRRCGGVAAVVHDPSDIPSTTNQANTHE